jgi:cytochrome c5
MLAFVHNKRELFRRASLHALLSKWNINHWENHLYSSIISILYPRRVGMDLSLLFGQSCRRFFTCIFVFLSFLLTVEVHAVSSTKEGEDTTATQVAGKATYERFCIACHEEGLIGAPKFGDETDWKPRLVGKTIDDLVNSAVNGLNVMPAQGTCSECSKDDLKAAINYMLPKS